MPVRRVLLLLLLSSFTAFAQDSATLTGHVICADSNAPARFAKVFLKSASPSKSGDDFLGLLNAASKAKSPQLSPEDAAAQKAQQAAAAKMLSALSDLVYSATVGVDGTYIFTNVKPGIYYVHAMAPGYIDPLAAFSSDDLTSHDPAVMQRIAAVATTVTINGTESARADLRLERGASITGQVFYDDGTPAAGWTVHPVYPSAAAPSGAAAGLSAFGIDASDVDLSHLGQTAVTDETGRFHIAGLPTGSYVLQARFVGSTLGTSGFNAITSNSGSPMANLGRLAERMGLRLTVYSGNTLRRSEAKAISVVSGEERTGVDLTMPLNSLHSISGHVIAKTDGHPVNSGAIELTAQDANGKPDPSLHFMASIHADGSFRFDYVPSPATFTLKTDDAADATTTSTKHMLGSTIAEQKTLHAYGSAFTTVQLNDSDLDNLSLTVPDISTTATAP